MKRYIIIDTEATRDFAGSLIGMMFKGEIKGKYINLHIFDGELLFARNEIKEL